MTNSSKRGTTIGMTLGLIMLAVALSAAPGTAHAGDYDGSKKLLCAPTDALQCHGAGKCDRVEVEVLNMPKFIGVDFKGKKLRGFPENSSDEETTPIKTVVKLDGQTVVQGVENGRGWSMVFDGGTGDFTLAIAGDDQAFVLFGVCHKD